VRAAASLYADLAGHCGGDLAPSLLPPLALVLGPWAPPVLLALSLHLVALGGLAMLVSGTEALRDAAEDADATAEGEDDGDGDGDGDGDDGLAPPSTGGEATVVALLRDGTTRTVRAPPHSPTATRPCTYACCDCWVLRFFRMLAGSVAHLPAALLVLASTHAFHATGHAPQFSALAYASAFVGVDAFWAPVSGSLLALNTFGASHILAVLFFAPVLAAASSAVVPGEIGPPGGKDCDAGWVGRWGWLEGQVAAAWAKAAVASPLSPAAAAAAPAASRFLLILLAPPSVSALCTCIFCFLARRELMVWAIFAPKFCFEAVGLGVTGLMMAGAGWIVQRATV
jgi:hypothetical protein